MPYSIVDNQWADGFPQTCCCKDHRYQLIRNQYYADYRVADWVINGYLSILGWIY